jgi:hypothetical protein
MLVWFDSLGMKAPIGGSGGGSCLSRQISLTPGLTAYLSDLWLPSTATWLPTGLLGWPNHLCHLTFSIFREDGTGDITRPTCAMAVPVFSESNRSRW